MSIFVNLNLIQVLIMVWLSNRWDSGNEPAYRQSGSEWHFSILFRPLFIPI